MAGFRLIHTPGSYRAAVNEVSLLSQHTIKVGFPKGEPIKAGTRTGSGHAPFVDMAEVASIAFVNDTARPFLAPAIAAGNKKIAAAYLEAARRIFDQRLTAEAGCAIVGEVAASVVRKYIRDFPHASISLKTSARKKSSKPLIDTGQMLNSVTFKVD